MHRNSGLCRTHGFVIAKRFRSEAEKVTAKRFRSEAEKDSRPLRKKQPPSGCFFLWSDGMRTHGFVSTVNELYRKKGRRTIRRPSMGKILMFREI